MAETTPFKYVESTTSPLEVDLDADEGAILKSIGVRGGADDEVARILVDSTTVNCYTVAPGSINHAPYKDVAQNVPWIVGQLINLGLVSEDYLPHFHTSLDIKLNTDPDLMYAVIDQREIGDVPPQEAPGGKNASEYLFVSYGETSGALDTDDEWFDLDQSKMPSELLDFPFASDPTFDYDVDPLAIGVYSERNVDTRADFLRVLMGGSPIFGEDRTGLSIDPMNENLLPYGGAAGDVYAKDLTELGTIPADTEFLMQVQANYDGANSLGAGNVHAFFAGIVRG